MEASSVRAPNGQQTPVGVENSSPGKSGNGLLDYFRPPPADGALAAFVCQGEAVPRSSIPVVALTPARVVTRQNLNPMYGRTTLLWIALRSTDVPGWAHGRTS